MNSINNNNRAGGIRPKNPKINWTKEADNTLLECVEEIDALPPTDDRLKHGKPKALRILFAEKMFERFQMKFTGSESSLTNRLRSIKTEPKPKDRKNLDWSIKQNQDILIKCGLKAMALKERDPGVSYLRTMYDKFVELVPDYTGESANLGIQFRKYSKQRTEAELKSIQTEIENDFIEKDLSTAANIFNMSADLRDIRKYRDIGISHGQKRLFSCMCSNCGKLLFGNDGDSQRWSTVTVDPRSPLPIREKFGPNLPKNIPWGKADNSRFLCRVCKSDPKLIDSVDIMNPETKYISIPEPLAEITDKKELGLIALLGVYQTTVKYADPRRRLYTHVQGEVNLLSKEEEMYIEMFSILREKNFHSRRRVDMQRVKNALFWLKRWNPLYQRFHSNIETLWPHLRPDQNPFLSKGDISFKTTKDKDITDELGEEEIALFLPANDYTAEYDPEEEDFDVGQTHPKDPIDEAKEDHRRLTHPGIYNRNLEALGFPKLFPGGTGSYNPKGPMKHRNWCKYMLLNTDDRWRRDTYFPFFCIDRFFKISLMTHHRCIIGQVGVGAVKKPTVGDLAEEQTKNVYTRYGSKVPANIQGSKSYWFVGTQELHAITQDMGRRPTYFITLTVDDSWEEIQNIVYHGADHKMKECDKCPHGSEISPAVNHALECSIAFNERFLKWKREIINKKDGPLGHVEQYWYRHEYQKRGMVHIHCVVWVKPGTEKPGVVMAEMPRGGPEVNANALKEMQTLVSKYQYHHCRQDRCFFSGSKKLKDCKYGFPQPLVNEERLAKDGVRKLYRRRRPEDERIVPYNLPTLLIMRSHSNIQEVSTDDGWNLYLTKYISKEEPTAKVRYPGDAVQKMSHVQRFITMRIMNAVEVMDILNQFPAKACSVDVMYLPIELIPTSKVIKRKEHRPTDPDSENVFYDSKIEKYLQRPKELKNLTYFDFFRQYKYAVKPKPKSSVNQPVESEDSDEEVDRESLASAPVERPLRDDSNRTVVKRRHPIVIRTRFMLPWGEDQEMYCLRLLLQNFPLNIGEDFISKENKTGTFLEECNLRGFWDPRDVSLAFLGQADSMGFSMLRLWDYARLLVKNNLMQKPEIIEYFKTHGNRDIDGPNFQKGGILLNKEDDPDSTFKFPVKERDLLTVAEYEAMFNEEQRRIFNYIRDAWSKGERVLAIIVGPAGTGKSLLLKAFCALCKDLGMSTEVLAPTGSAAYLIDGRTIHSLFRFDTNLKAHIKYNSIYHLMLSATDTLLIDEMSMIDVQQMDKVEYNLRRFAIVPEAKIPDFAGKNIILFGDPAQLPPWDDPFFIGEHMPSFKIFNLKTIERQDDREFIEILQQVRLGKVDHRAVKFFEARKINRIDYNEVVENNVTVIVALRKQRDAINAECLKLIPGELRTFVAKDTDMAGHPLSEALQARLEACKEKFRKEVRIKVNSLVVLKRNINPDAGQVNGRIALVDSIGEDYVILRSLDGNEHFAVRPMTQTIKDYGQDKYKRTQIPIDNAYGATVHRVQGMT